MTPELLGLDQFELIPRELIFGNPERSLVKISPDGTYLSWLAPRDGVLNIWVAPSDDIEAALPVTNDPGRGIREYRWSYRPGTLLYRQDTGGDEDFHIYSVDVESGTVLDLTPMDKVSAVVDGLSHLRPDQVLLGINDRDAAWHDMYLVDLVSGARTLVELNTESIAGYLVDGDYNVTHAVRATDAGGTEYLRRAADGGWEVFDEVPFEESVSIPLFGPTADGTTLYLTDTRGRNTAALFSVDTTTYERTLLHEDPRADVANVLRRPGSGEVEGVSVNYLTAEWEAIGDGPRADLVLLQDQVAGDLIVDSRTLDDRTWIVSGSASDTPVTYYRYEREGEGTLTRLFSVRPRLEGMPLVKRHPVEILSRDGKTLVSYLAVPPHVGFDPDGGASQTTPMVVLVHGGPWHRDSYGYDAWVQWLANRGYSVLQVNFRGSTGLGKDFTNAGNGEWAGKMHDDLLDAVEWAIERGVTTPGQVGIMGGSYGGYATLVGLTFTPDVFACGVDIVGPSNLHTLLATVPPYWASFYKQLTRRMGDPETDEGRAWLTERSPLNRVDAISKPLLIGQGANDPRVKQAESDQIVDALTERNIPVTYVLFPDEGHGFARPANNKAMNAIVEGFLGACLGGRVEPIGEDLDGSSIEVPTGADLVADLVEALERHQPS